MAKTIIPSEQTQTLGCSVRRTASQSIATATITAVTFTDEVSEWSWNDGGYGTPAHPNSYTCKRTGKYLVEIQGTIVQLASGKTWYSYIYVNGSLHVRTWNTTTTANYERPSSQGALMVCNKGDYISMRVYHNGGVNEDLYYGDYLSLCVAYMGK